MTCHCLDRATLKQEQAWRRRTERRERKVICITLHSLSYIVSEVSPVSLLGQATPRRWARCEGANSSDDHCIHAQHHNAASSPWPNKRVKTALKELDKCIHRKNQQAEYYGVVFTTSWNWVHSLAQKNKERSNGEENLCFLFFATLRSHEWVHLFSILRIQIREKHFFYSDFVFILFPSWNNSNTLLCTYYTLSVSSLKADNLFTFSRSSPPFWLI